MTVNERFDGKVFRGGDCHTWRGCIDRKGYGHFRINRKSPLAHRVAYELYVGKIPSGMCVLHRCDNRACVNPDHLFIGTNDDNVADRVRKGRSMSMPGEDNPGAKVTRKLVLKIRADSRSCRSMAREYGLSHVQIAKIKGRRAWA